MIMIVMAASFMKNKIAIASSREEIYGRCPVILLIETDIPRGRLIKEGAFAQ